ncbi:hypothetical protein [Corynebacterium hylobatis]|nr:hypothetical protein [Corynebacterium hylobatis]
MIISLGFATSGPFLLFSVVAVAGCLLAFSLRPPRATAPTAAPQPVKTPA